MRPQQMFVVGAVCWTLGGFIPGLTGLPAWADTRPVSAIEDVTRLPAAAAELYRDTTLFPRPVKYQQIPWLLDLDEAIRQAKKENRPVLIWTSGDDPLERC
jgi:hypothetical protein